MCHPADDDVINVSLYNSTSNVMASFNGVRGNENRPV